MNFREYVTEGKFCNKSLSELETLLKNADKSDIDLIKNAIKKLKGKKSVQTAGNQDLGSADTISIGGSGNMAAASPDGAGPGQGNAE